MGLRKTSRKVSRTDNCRRYKRPVSGDAISEEFVTSQMAYAKMRDVNDLCSIITNAQYRALLQTFLSGFFNFTSCIACRHPTADTQGSPAGSKLLVRK